MIRCIGNAGMLVAAEGAAVLIDALHGPQVEAYHAPSLESVERIMAGEPPFDALDALCVTHAHPDHFSASLVARLLRARPELSVYGPPDVMRALAAEGCRREALHALAPTPGEVVSMPCGSGTLHAALARHSGHHYAHVVNLALVLCGKISYAHPGDAINSPATLRMLAQAGALRGVLMLPFSFALVERGFDRVVRVLRPRAILLHHLPKAEDDEYGWMRMAQANADRARCAGVDIAFASEGLVLDW